MRTFLRTRTNLRTPVVKSNFILNIQNDCFEGLCSFEIIILFKQRQAVGQGLQRKSRSHLSLACDEELQRKARCEAASEASAQEEAEARQILIKITNACIGQTDTSAVSFGIKIDYFCITIKI